MRLAAKDCCILNGGNAAWAFEPLAAQLSQVLGIEVSGEPRRFNYLLQAADPGQIATANLFVPLAAIQLAADKRRLAEIFNQYGVATPYTRLFDTFEEVLGFIRDQPAADWCLKYPTSCGANGHRKLTPASEVPDNWPRPFVVQEFINLVRPEVYRTYGAAGELFGWVVRRYPEGAKSSPWVAHAQGARYLCLGDPPEAARGPAQAALVAAQLWDSFGCVDLLRRPGGEWLVLEVGTDGLFNHIDRDLGDADMENHLNQRVAAAFWRAAEKV